MSWNVLNWSGPHFLLFYVVGFWVAIGLWWIVQFLLRAPGDLPSNIGNNLTSFDLAYLRGAAKGAEETALVTLWQRGLLRAHAASRTFERAPAPVPTKGLHPLEKRMLSRVGDREISTDDLLQRDLGVEGTVIEVFTRRLVLTPAERVTAQVAAEIPLVLMACLGLAKIGVGISRHRPVEFLLLFEVATGLMLTVLPTLISHRTRRGERLFQRLRHEYSAYQFVARRPGVDLSLEDVAQGACLFGIAALEIGPCAMVAGALKPKPKPASYSSSSCGSSSCGGAGCGGGGCGGGCGGGGCGGCSG